MADVPPGDTDGVAGGDEADDRLLAELHAVMGDEPLPPRLLDICSGLLAMADLDTELTALLADASDTVGVRSGSDTTELAPGEPLVFEAGDDYVIEVDPDGEDVTGTVLPAVSGQVAIEQPGRAAIGVAIDPTGGFRFIGVPRGPTRIVVRASDGTSVATDWFVR